MDGKAYEEVLGAHEAKAQFYRWFAVWERPDMGFAQLESALASDFSFVADKGEVMDGGELRDALESRNKGELRSHRVVRASVTDLDDDGLMLTARVLFQLLDVEDVLTAAMRHYTVKLRRGSESELPKIESVKVDSAERVDSEFFEDTFPENRSQGCFYYWLAMVECRPLRRERIGDLLSERFVINTLQGEHIRNAEAALRWLDGRDFERVAVYPLSTRLRHVDSRHYGLSSDYDIKGMRHSGEEVPRYMHCEWVLEESGEAFPKLKEFHFSKLR